MEKIYLHLCTGLLAAGGVKSLSIMPPRSGVKWKILSAYRQPDLAVTADNTDYISERWYKGAGTSAPITAARATTVAGTGYTVHVPEAVAFTGTPSEMECTTASPIHIDITAAASGKAFAFTFPVEIEVIS